MPSDYRIDERQKTVWTVSEGLVTDQDLVGMYKRMGEDAEFRPDYKELCDFTDATAVQVTTEAVRRLAVRTPFAEGALHAIVAPDPVVYGLSRMYQAYVEASGTDSVRVFTDLQSAADWLGVDPSPRRPTR